MDAKKSNPIVGFIIVVLIFYWIKNGCNDDKSKSEATNSDKENTAQQYKVGQTAQTDYFEVTVNKVQLVTKINTGNEFIDEEYNKKNEDNYFLILDVTVKNINTESRYFPNGVLIANYNGKELKYDNAEDIIGYTFMYEQLNPLISKSSKVVYMLPKELAGLLYWIPGRSNVRIVLGNINSKK
jgi:hypothetical protein